MFQHVPNSSFTIQSSAHRKDWALEVCDLCWFESRCDVFCFSSSIRRGWVRTFLPFGTSDERGTGEAEEDTCPLQISVFHQTFNHATLHVSLITWQIFFFFFTRETEIGLFFSSCQLWINNQFGLWESLFRFPVNSNIKFPINLLIRGLIKILFSSMRISNWLANAGREICIRQSSVASLRNYFIEWQFFILLLDGFLFIF